MLDVQEWHVPRWTRIGWCPSRSRMLQVSLKQVIDHSTDGPGKGVH
jgi:hypothetical protein